MSWARVGVAAGFLAVVSYTLISTLSPPLRLSVVLASVFGPSLAVASVGLYHLLRLETRTVSLDLGVASNVVAGVAGVAVTLMLFAQLGLKEWFESHVAAATFDVPAAVVDADLATAMGIYLPVHRRGARPGGPGGIVSLHHAPALRADGSRLKKGPEGERSSGRFPRSVVRV
jgi:hypothetical protein